MHARSRRTFDVLVDIINYNIIPVISIFERSRMFFEQRFAILHKQERKNISKMNKEVGMLLPKKELIQVYIVGKSNNFYEDIYICTSLQQHPLTNHTYIF